MKLRFIGEDGSMGGMEGRAFHDSFLPLLLYEGICPELGPGIHHLKHRRAIWHKSESGWFSVIF